MGKSRHNTSNWRQYNRALINHGSLTDDGTSIRPELQWAEQLFDDGELALWQFRSFDLELSLSLAPMQMQSVCPEGLWVLAEWYGQHNLWRLGSVQALPVTVGKQQLERQLAWLSEEQRTLLLDVWSMLAYIDDKALQSFLLDVLRPASIFICMAVDIYGS